MLLSTHPQMILSKNSLTDLPEYLFDLPNLSNLDLSHNTLRHLPFKFWKAPKLHTLNASNNSIEVIPTNWPAVLQECIIINTSPPLDQASSTQVICHFESLRVFDGPNSTILKV